MRASDRSPFSYDTHLLCAMRSSNTRMFDESCAGLSRAPRARYATRLHEADADVASADDGDDGGVPNDETQCAYGDGGT